MGFPWEVENDVTAQALQNILPEHQKEAASVFALLLVQGSAELLSLTEKYFTDFPEADVR